jgi:glycosyltransferase involved in cell wall biosynthesis
MHCGANVAAGSPLSGGQLDMMPPMQNVTPRHAISRTRQDFAAALCMNVDQAFVSVVLPTCNRAHTLFRSIGSVLEQQHNNLELIVVDDGSTDRTRELVRDICDTRIRYIRFDRNRGQSAARNAGIAASHGELIAFQDSDDQWAPEKLARQLPALLDDPGLAGVYCDFRRRQLDGASFVVETPDLAVGAIFDRRPSFYQSSGVGIQTCILRKSTLRDAGLFNERLRCFEDLELLLRIARKHRLRRVPGPLVDYFESEQSVSKNAFAERKARIFLLKCYGYRAIFNRPRWVIREAKTCLWGQGAGYS